MLHILYYPLRAILWCVAGAAFIGVVYLFLFVLGSVLRDITGGSKR